MSESTPDIEAERRTYHWSGIAALALVVGAVGAIAARPGLVLASVVFVAFAGYAWTARPVATHADGAAIIEIERHLDEPQPDPGESVTVTVAVRNAGETRCPDVRVVDGVPDGLAVVAGTPRHGAALRPGGRSTFAYTVRARRGEHEWGDAAVTVADPLDVVERTFDVACETRLRCSLPETPADDGLARAVTDWLPGPVETDTGGAGLEFHATREYRPTDPRTRIDWYRRARTGELGTIDYREERAATVVLLIDARRGAYRSPGPDATHAVDRSVEAADHLFSALLSAGHRVGLAAIGPRADCWLDPGAGDDHRATGRALLNEHPALSTHPPERDRSAAPTADARRRRVTDRVERLHRRLPDSAAVVLLSPCCDDEPTTIARRLWEYGRTVTVCSPDPTVATSVETRLARLERADRLDGIRRERCSVIDWPRDEPLERALVGGRGVRS
ncbi:DUF58 domain-containing protein [Halovivax limisalsi]|uniref:DUF58 domain-containing protein n=1 Tax=Halovivax limisalsi TaxID=1453760 RepID=UPI001FFD8286|nr:DUF58 domain-containing protein [Halovivax limisalsi]